MRTIVIVQRTIPEFRVGLIQALRKRYKVVVLCGSNYSSLEDVVIVPIIDKFGLFWFKDLNSHLSPNDILILEGNLRILNIVSLILSGRRLVLWGPWLSTRRVVRLIQRYVLSLDKIIPMYYYESHKTEFVRYGIQPNDGFTALNTIHISPRPTLITKRGPEFCFIGTMNARKGLDIIIESFNLLKQTGHDFKLHLIGDGPLKSELQQKVSDYNLEPDVVFHGRIEDTQALNAIISRCRASVSYGQAGLSILHSFAFGTPYVTMKYAISGGETSCITHKVNGYLCHSITEFNNILVHLVNNDNSQAYSAAYEFYWQNANSDVWADSVIAGLQKHFNEFRKAH